MINCEAKPLYFGSSESQTSRLCHGEETKEEELDENVDKVGGSSAVRQIRPINMDL